MSEFLAEARILVRPDTTRFRAQLQEEVTRAVSQARIPPVEIPLILGRTGAGIAAVSAATGALATAQAQAAQSTLGLASAAQVENSALGRQATILQATTTATIEKAGADAAATRAARAHAASQASLGRGIIASTASFTGLRGAVLSAGTAFLAGAIGVQLFARGVQSAANLHTELEVFRQTAGATADEMERVGEAARQLGRDIELPGVTAEDAAQTLSLLARAGLDVNDSLGAVRGTLQLATAAQIDNAQATELVANALNSFKLAGTEATRVADLFAGAAQASQGSILDMGIALRQVSAVSSGLGVSLEDTATLLTQLSRAGLSSSDAGTALRTTFLRLIQDLPKVNEEVERLGLNLRDAGGNIRPEIFEELGQKLRKLTPAARQTALANLGGADALRVYLLLAREATGTFDEVQRAITEQGIASDTAAARTAGLTGDVEAATNEFATLGETVGRVASGPLSFLARTATVAAGAINDMNREVEETNVFQELGRDMGNFLNNFERINIILRAGATGADRASSSFSVFDGIIEHVNSTVQEFNDALTELGTRVASRISTPGDDGLGVQQILNRVAGFDSAGVRAQIRGNTDELVSILEDEQEFLQSQLDRPFVQNRAALRDRLQNALLGTIRDIESISNQSSSEARRAAAAAKAAREEADRALLEALGTGRDRLQNLLARAEGTEGVGDDIRIQNRIQARIRRQIAIIQDQVKGEDARRAAVLQLRRALIDSRNAERDLRQQRRQDEIERRREAIEQRTRGVELDIELADINENDRRRISLRERLIAQLKRERRVLKLTGNALKENRNEIARIRKEIEAIKGEERKAGKSFQERSFEFLQAQQGFAANLFGNLIPSSATAGLVGNISPSTRQSAHLGGALSRDLMRSASLERAKTETGFTAGQGNATNALLISILGELKKLNRSEEAPENQRQRKRASAMLDGAGSLALDISFP